MKILSEISAGELLDKITILEIKIDKIKQKIILIFLRLAKSIILTRNILNNPLSAAPFDTDLTSS